MPNCQEKLQYAALSLERCGHVAKLVQIQQKTHSIKRTPYMFPAMYD